MPGGRPSEFSKERTDYICEQIADGRSLRSICKDNGMPSIAAVCRWLSEPQHAEFRERYARAREAQADSLFDEVIDIADDGTNDWMKKNDPYNSGYVENGESLRRSQIRIDARKWMAGKLRPKKYGDKQVIENTGPGGGPVAITSMTSEEFEERARRIARQVASGEFGNDRK